VQLRLVFLAILTTAAFAADAPQVGPTLTAEQKFEALQLQIKATQIQEVQKGVQDKFKTLSDSACGKNASLTFTTNSQGDMEPVCQVTPPPPQVKK
jgi:hypothetical protein